MNSSAYWMARVARTARALSEIKHLRRRGLMDDAEVRIAQDSFDNAVRMYTNPHNVPKGI